MGLSDRDYMYEKTRVRSFQHPPGRQGKGFFKIVLVFALLLYALFSLSKWALGHRYSKFRPQTSSPQVALELKSTPQHTFATEPIPAFDSGASPQHTTRSVTKCVLAGKVSYHDYSCERGAIATEVATRSDQNLLAAVRPNAIVTPIHLSETAPQAPVATQGSIAPLAPPECKSMDAQIANLDAMARQSQSGQMQDRIKSERKELRDRQFRIHCR
jgi:hypothetical protein